MDLTAWVGLSTDQGTEGMASSKFGILGFIFQQYHDLNAPPKHPSHSCSPRTPPESEPA